MQETYSHKRSEGKFSRGVKNARPGQSPADLRKRQIRHEAGVLASTSTPVL